MKFFPTIGMLVYIGWADLRNKQNPFRIIEKSYARMKKHGRKQAYSRLKKEYRKLCGLETSKNIDYLEWIKIAEKRWFLVPPVEQGPLISVVMPVYNTQPKLLIEAIMSVRGQTYSNWELCIADDASTNLEVRKILQNFSQADPRIKVVYREKNGNISQATNSALALASGEFLAFFDHDDLLHPRALSEVVEVLVDGKYDLLYTDEDKVSEAGDRYEPHFKTDFNPDLLYSQNYISHLSVIRRSLVQQVGGLREGYEGSQDYDLILRCVAQIDDKRIVHIPKILYHWRATWGSVAFLDDHKESTANAGMKALRDYFSSSQNIEVQQGMWPTTYRVVWPLPTPEPLVSIIIPTRNGVKLLKQCIKSIREKTLYSNYEILVVDNGSDESETLEYLGSLSALPQVQILQYPEAFNFSAINNFAVQKAKGDLVALVNNDIEVISPDWLTEMVSQAMRPDIGCVGAKLLYPSGEVQHAGVVLGIGGVAGHVHKHLPGNNHGYFSRLGVVQNYSAVTAACLVIRKELYEKVHGLDETFLKIAFNDVDFCLKIRSEGYRNLWTPYAILFHHESVSRGYEDTPEKRLRFDTEVAFMKKKWGNMLTQDPYYNPNLTLNAEQFQLQTFDRP